MVVCSDVGSAGILPVHNSTWTVQRSIYLFLPRSSDPFSFQWFPARVQVCPPKLVRYPPASPWKVPS